MADLVCPICGKAYHRSNFYMYKAAKRGQVLFFCSRDCCIKSKEKKTITTFSGKSNDCATPPEVQR